MPSPHSVLIARCLLAPATLMWCRLLLDNPGQRMAKAWSRAFFQQATRCMGMSNYIGHVGTGGRVEPRLAQGLSGSAPDVTDTLGAAIPKSSQQVHDRGLVPAPAAAREHATGIQLVGNGAEAGMSVGAHVLHDRRNVSCVTVGVTLDRCP